MNARLIAIAVTAIMTKNVMAQEHAQRKPRIPFKTDTMMVHDPVMAYEDGTYYIYSTGMGIQAATSTDRKTWTVHPEGLLRDIPAWTHDSVPGFERHIWAPDIIRWHGKWWLTYSCSTFGKNGSAIGLMSNSTLNPSSPNYHWEDLGCLVCSKEGRDNWNAIDPNIVIDENDQGWMVWGSFWDGIQIAPLETSGSTLRLAGAPRTLARRHVPGSKFAEPNPTSQFAGRNAIEAPFIMKKGRYYYLFVSWDYCCRGSKSNYRVAVGRSHSVDGPYLDKDGLNMLYGGGCLLAEGDKKIFEAMGHCSAYTMNGEDLFLCHGYSIEKGGASLLVQKKIRWQDDWPILEP